MQHKQQPLQVRNHPELVLPRPRTLLAVPHAKDSSQPAPVRMPDPDARQRALLLSVVRGVFIVLVVVVTFLALIRAGEGDTTAFEDRFGSRWYVPVGLGIVLAFIFVAIDIFTPRKKISSIVAITFGLLAGLIIAFALGFVIDLVVETWGLSAASDEIGARVIGTLKLLLAISLCYVGITTVLQTKDEFRLVIPYVEFAKQFRGTRPLLTDTSALIDARLHDLAATGIIQSPIIIPRFVVNELQTLADSADRMKRQRGRRGLDIIAKMQRQPALDVSVDETPLPGKAVDQMLVDLAASMPGIILTTDNGLCRIARIQGVTAVNINDLASALKPALIPGERVRIEIAKPGDQPGQGVGYLPDGTMVVVEHGREMLGHDTEVEITGSIQTASGRMLFASATEQHGASNSASATKPAARSEVRSEAQPDARPETRPEARPEPSPASEPTPDTEPTPVTPNDSLSPPRRSPRPGTGSGSRNPRRS